MVEPLLLLVVLHSLYVYDGYVPVAGADDGDLVFLLTCHVVNYSLLVYSIRCRSLGASGYLRAA